ncbi:hypothetical protein D9M70_546130 [compost metagenome]
MTPQLPSLKRLRQQAKLIKQQRGMKHGQALHEIAQLYGFKSWNGLLHSHPEHQTA